MARACVLDIPEWFQLAIVVDARFPIQRGEPSLLQMAEREGNRTRGQNQARDASEVLSQ